MGTQRRAAAGGGASGGDAAALAEIQRRQERVIETVLVPIWYWWAMGVAMVAIGVARDHGQAATQAVVIPAAVIAMAGLTARTLPDVRRRIRLHGTVQPGPRGAAGIIALIVLVDGTIVATAASLGAAHEPDAATIATAAGAAVLVIAGPLANRYLSALMRRKVHQRTGDTSRMASRIP